MESEGLSLTLNPRTMIFSQVVAWGALFAGDILRHLMLLVFAMTSNPNQKKKNSQKKKKTTASRIPAWSPTAVLTGRYLA